MGHVGGVGDKDAFRFRFLRLCFLCFADSASILIANSGATISDIAMWATAPRRVEPDANERISVVKRSLSIGDPLRSKT
jgi:hypothetical protein